MSPRKKSRGNDQAPANDNLITGNDASGDRPKTPVKPDTAIPEPRTPAASIRSTASSRTLRDERRPSLRNKSSWYGSFNGKSAAIAQLSNESVSASNDAAANPGNTRRSSTLSDSAKPSASSRMYLQDSGRRSSKSIAAAESLSRLNLSDNKPRSILQEEEEEHSTKADIKQGTAVPSPPDPKKLPGQADGSKDQPAQEHKQSSSKTGSAPWYGWWSKPDGVEDSISEAKEAEEPQEQGTNNAMSTPLPGTKPKEDAEQKTGPLNVPPKIQIEDSSDGPTVTGASSASGGKSWFWSWSSTQNARETTTASQLNTPRIEPADSKLPEPPKAEELAEPAKAPKTEPSKEAPSPDKAETKDRPKSRETTSKPASWAFWSKEKPGPENSDDAASTLKQVGEIAVADTPSHNNPEAAQFNEHEQQQKLKEPVKPARGRKRPMSTDSTPSTPIRATPAQSPERKLVPPSSPEQDKSQTQQETQEHKQGLTPDSAKQGPLNTVLPILQTTYSVVEQPTYWQQVRAYFFGPEPTAPHLHIEPNPPRIKKALCIGVHGFFPAAMFQTIFGQPTGTSIKFANAGAKAIKDWTTRQGYECEIEKVALEGEGFIADRVDSLWKLLLNWIEQIRAADFIFVTAHSQGVPVATMLVAKLIQFGCTSSARIGICAMAGINLGPFPEYRTKLFGASALELFDFCRPDSKVSMMYEEALEVVLGFGVKITYIGSIDDQLVSMDSSTFSPLTHPLIYRAAFVDGRLHSPDFITSLICFVLKLRNLGISDHGLMREISPPLAGSLYTGDGHSRLYEDPIVFNLAIEHALGTTNIHAPSGPSAATNTLLPASLRKADDSSASGVKMQLNRKTEAPAASAGAVGANPYFLPWAMRGILEEDFVKKECQDEVQELLRLFEEWKPVSKGLKDIKWRLEVVRSKMGS
ncbi:hypothetical protein LTS18_011439 [Coniosporium uncinatum]|uniref:Uncharacterized protein n=1 Tax=Coniosporium uncinatum TaxID=93489 RepID=A0ACC3DWE2_9PEZI|nr:hypothetical protein LTS18_011439 [Coniosporium uncinatum]